MEYNELILDMLNRIVKLEKEIEILKSKDCKDDAEKPIIPVLEEKTVQRDKTRYMFNGNIYLKNKLVLAVIQDYVIKNPQVKCNELKSILINRCKAQ